MTPGPGTGRAVHVVEDAIDPPVSGADIRNRAIFDGLSRLFETTALALRNTFPGRRRNGTVVDLGEGEAAAVVARVLETRPQLVVLEGVAMLRIARRLARRPHRPRLVVDMHNLEGDLLGAVLRERAPKPLRGFAALRHAAAVRAARAADLEIAALADAVWVCSERDRDRLLELLPAAPPVHVVPNPVPRWCSAARIPERAAAAPLSALFVGHLGYRPNIHAVRRLADRIWPRVRARHATARLVVAGRSPHRSLVRRAEAGRLELVADPDDLAPLYRAATLAVLPITAGGGTRIKALEALAAGVPMVATATAVEGLGLEAGRHYLRAETDGAFADAITELHRAVAVRRAIVREGRDLVRTRHGPEVVGRAIERALAPHDPTQAAR